MHEIAWKPYEFGSGYANYNKTHSCCETTKVTATIFFIISSSVLGQYAQRHFAQGHYAQGHYAQGNYAQTEITPKKITPKEITPKRKLRPRKLSYSKRIAAIIFRLLFEEVYIFFVWLGRFAPFAK